MELLPGSAAIDAGDPAFLPPPDFDQRGASFPRVSNGTIDIGAYEVQPIAPPSADFDRDGIVDGRDFLAWQRGFGIEAPSAVKSNGDADNDRDVDAVDLAVWKTQFGSSATIVALNTLAQARAASAISADGSSNSEPVLAYSEPTLDAATLPGKPSSAANLNSQLVDAAMAERSNVVQLTSRRTEWWVESRHRRNHSSVLNPALASRVAASIAMIPLLRTSAAASEVERLDESWPEEYDLKPPTVDASPSELDVISAIVFGEES
jgi:hypothetical protein